MLTLPKRLLRQTAEVRIPKDSFYAGEFDEPRIIDRVLFEPASSAGGTQYQGANPIKGTLFIDPAVSIGAFQIPAGSLVKVDGMQTEAIVSECEAVMYAGKVHHWEAILR